MKWIEMSFLPKWFSKFALHTNAKTDHKPHATTPLPSQEEWELARARLEEVILPANFGELGGFRPKNTEDRCASWWGGNFLSMEGEGIPRCDASGNEMLPIFQVKTDELPFVPEFLDGITLMTLWFDPETEHIWEAKNGTGFVIRTYGSLDNLVPVGLGYRQHKTLPTFPIRWHLHNHDLPDWEDFADQIPSSVACQNDSSWFFDHAGFEARATLQQTMPIKIGGHAQWWQSPQEVEDSKFGFFLDSTPRGSFGFPAGGNANFFFGANGWEMRVDCT